MRVCMRGRKSITERRNVSTVLLAVDYVESAGGSLRPLSPTVSYWQCRGVSSEAGYGSCNIARVLAHGGVGKRYPCSVDEADENLLPFLSSGPDQAYLVEPTKTFPLLELRAPIANILIREMFTDGEERKIASILSGHESSGRWRKVALPSSPQLISGWVSLERDQERQEGNDIREPLRDDGAPDGQHKADDQVRTDDYSNAGERIELNVQQPDRELPTAVEEQDPSQETQVLLVSHNVLQAKESAVALGLGKRYPILYNFLCLRRYDGEGVNHPKGFERIGLGKMFGWEVERLYGNADKEDLWLF